MIQGVDVSHWNKDYLVRTNYRAFTESDFVIFKATEGRSYKDSAIDHYLSIYLSSEKPYGLYHFARPDKNDAVVEARHFLEVAKSHIGKAIFVLDVEGTALHYPKLKKWVVTWCHYIINQTGVIPLIYCSESACTRIASDELMQLNVGLWCARYNKNEPRKAQIKPWKFWAIWQYKSVPIDCDFFNGTIEQFKKYMTVHK